MRSDGERLKQLTDLSERASDLRLLAARMEPIGEELQQRKASAKYGLGRNPTSEREAQVRARTTQLGNTATGILEAVEELREMADRVEGLIGDARKLFGKEAMADV